MSVDQAGSSEVARHVARTAACLFAQHGYEATSVRAIVEAAGVTKPTLYYHFGSKEGLAQALLHRPLTGLVDTLAAIAAGDGSPVERLERLVDAHFAFCREEPDRARFYYALCVGPHDTDLTAELMKYGPQLDAPIAIVLDVMSETGIVARDRAMDLLFAFRGLIKSRVTDFLYREKTDGVVDLDAALARRLVSDLLYGFAISGRDGQESRR